MDDNKWFLKRAHSELEFNFCALGGANQYDNFRLIEVPYYICIYLLNKMYFKDFPTWRFHSEFLERSENVIDRIHGHLEQINANDQQLIVLVTSYVDSIDSFYKEEFKNHDWVVLNNYVKDLNHLNLELEAQIIVDQIISEGLEKPGAWLTPQKWNEFFSVVETKIKFSPDKEIKHPFNYEAWNEGTDQEKTESFRELIKILAQRGYIRQIKALLDNCKGERASFLPVRMASRKGKIATKEAVELLKLVEQTLEKNNINFMEYIFQFGQLQAALDRKNGKVFTFNEHIRGLILSKLSSQRPWKKIADNLENIQQIFFNYDPEKILRKEPQYYVDLLKSIHCGNRSIHKQMAVLSENILVMDNIVQKYRSMDAFVTNDDPINIAIQLSYPGPTKLKQIGVPLALEYLKNVGIDTCKPDLHLRRILSKERLNYTSKFTESEHISEIVTEIAKEVGYSVIYLDNLLWLLCAENYGNICGKVPKCYLCDLREICNYPINNKYIR